MSNSVSNFPNRCALALRCSRSVSFEGGFLLISGNINFTFSRRTDDQDYVDSTLRLSSPNVSKTALVSCKRRMCVVIQTIPSTALSDRQPPLIQMILPLLFLLASLLQQYGSEAESSHVSKFHPPSVKEQNGEFLLLFVTFRNVIEHKPGSFPHITKCSFLLGLHSFINTHLA